jgi:drug/metabolite transporter (DMT)-like permease
MNIAILWALASLVCAGLVDLTYKRYAMRARSRGVFLCGMGAVWLVLQSVVVLANQQHFTLDATTVRYGLAAGLAVTLSNLLLIEAMTHLDVSLGSTIYRLNTIAVVALAFIFLGETTSVFALLGIASGVTAVVFLYQRQDTGGMAHLPRLFLSIAILAALLRATFGVVSKAALEANANYPGLLIIGATCWMVGGFAYSAWRERPIRFDWQSASLTLFGGLVVFGTVNTLLLALQYGNASVVIPVANLGFTLALIIGVAWGMERLTMRKCVAMLFAVVAIFLLSV